MASHGVPGGFRGSCQTASAIWRADGVRGFYRGFGTVVFGTIPGRTVYLTALELTKAAVQRNEALVEAMAPSALAGASNFVAGGVASLATQLVAVPVDVISQRLMVHGADLGVAHAGGRASSSGSSSDFGGGSGSSSRGGSGGGGGGRAGASGAQVSGNNGGGGSGSRNAAGAQQRRSFSSLRATQRGAAAAAAVQPHGQGPCNARQRSQQLQQWRRALGRACSSGVSGSGGGGGGSTSGALDAAAVAAGSGGGGRMNGLVMARLIIREEGLRGLWRGLVPSAALYVPNR
jgi:hypothetical protein